MAQYFTTKRKVMAEKNMLVNFGGWPALLPRVKVTCPPGASVGQWCAGKPLLGSLLAWDAVGRQPCFREVLMPGEKKPGLGRSP